MGAGMFNYYTAQADSIETDTWMRLNEYIFQSVRQASMREQARIAGGSRRTRRITRRCSIGS